MAAVGGLAGLAVAAAGVRLWLLLSTTFVRIDLGVQLPFPRLPEVRLDAVVLAWTMGISIATGLLFGLAPALQALPFGPGAPIRQAARSAHSGRLSSGMRGSFVVVQVALATALSVGAGLVMHSFAKLTHVDAGYRADNVLTFQLAVPPSRHPGAEVGRFASDVVGRLGAIPGIEAAAYGSQVPMVAIRETAWFRTHPEVPGQPEPGGPEIRLVSRDYLKALGMRVVAGRGFTKQDGEGAPRVLVVNETLARREFAGQNAVGAMVFVARDTAPWQIVGIVADVRQFGLDRDPGPQVFGDLRQWPNKNSFPLGPYFLVRARDPLSIVSDVRTIVQEQEPQAGLFNVATMPQLLANSISRQRMYAALFGAFSAVAATLATIGVYGVATYAATRRTREFGIRMATHSLRGDPIGALRQE